jgi:hypothetical protein
MRQILSLIVFASIGPVEYTRNCVWSVISQRDIVIRRTAL